VSESKTKPNLVDQIIGSETTTEKVDPKLALAYDVTTKPATLTELAKSPNTEIVRAVALNPNTPFVDLLGLVVRFPNEVAGNPIISFKFYKTFSTTVEGKNDYEEIYTALSNPTIACRLSLSDKPELNQIVSYYDFILTQQNDTQEDSCYSNFQETYELVRQAAASNSNITQEQLAILVTDSEWRIRQAVYESIINRAISDLFSNVSH
jgi:hypothetical protein